jgi:alpha-mannosidase
VHGENFPLGLVVQYSGMGLWGRNYTINGPTHIHYALMPHKGKWDKAKIWSASADWNQPLVVWAGDINPGVDSKPMISSVSDGVVLSYARVDYDDLTLRVFNAEGENGLKSIKPNFRYDKAILKTLDGVQLEEFPFNERGIMLNIPRFGFRTLEFTGVRTSAGKH